MQVRINEIGKNLKDKGDIYLTVVGAIVTAILEAIGVLSPPVVFSSILGILCVISLSVLRNRWTSDEMSRTFKEGMTEFHEIKDIIPKKDAIEIYEKEEEAEEALIEYINERNRKEDPVIKATLIQYSILLKITKKLLESNTDLVLFFQDEATAHEIGSQQQYNFILQSLYNLRTGMSKPLDQCKIEIRKYKVPCSIGFIALDNDVLCVSWYAYVAPDQTNRWILGPECKDDKCIIRGHDKGAIIIRKEHPGFLALKHTFSQVEENYRNNSLQEDFSSCVQEGSVTQLRRTLGEV